VEDVSIEGVIYTTVFNPFDGRKNWLDLICAFCIALREAEDATLIVKLTHNSTQDACRGMLDTLYRLTPFKCRVVIVRGYISDADYESLVLATTYIVNTSTGEGQCLPLMEFMSCGKPAIAPRHTSMLDYVDNENTFVVKSSLELSAWPHDWRQGYRTLRHRLDIGCLIEQYAESYRVAKTDHARYTAMSNHAVETMRAHCSKASAFEKLTKFLAETQPT
jgi:glycosyltransferase involved in cell wall biosynthesis